MNDSYRKQRKKRQLKNGAAIATAIFLILFVLFFTQYIEDNYVKDTSKDQFVNLNNANFVTLINDENTIWSYADNGIMPKKDHAGRTWKDLDYDDSDWKKGKGSFGSVKGKKTDHVGSYPANLLNHYTKNQIAVPVYYFRTEFHLSAVDENWELDATIEFDDAVVIYLNGEAIYTSNVPDGGFDADGYGAAKRINHFMKDQFKISDTSQLKKGRNVLCVEVHQASKSSSDEYFSMNAFTYQVKAGKESLSNANNIILEPGADESSVTVNMLTEQKGKFKLQYAKRDDFTKSEKYEEIGMEIESSKSTKAHCYTATIDNLTPDAEYVYRIASLSESEVSKTYKYINRDTSKGFSFLFLGDPQIGAGTIETDRAEWRETLEAGASMSSYDSSFAISSGDQIDSANENTALREYLSFRNPGVLRTMPLVAAKGNHETGNDLYDIQFKRQYFSYGNTLFVHINGNSDKYLKNRLFLEECIDKTKPRWIVVIMHHSLFGSGPHAQEKKILRARDFYGKCFKELNVDLVLSGHDHLYSRSYLMSGKKSTGKDGGTKAVGETMYLCGNSSSGSKYYRKNAKKYQYLAELQQAKVPYFSSVHITENELTITTYETKKLSKVDYCKIKK